VQVVDEREDSFGRSINTYGPLDTKRFCLGGGDDKNQRDPNSDDDHDSQNHARLCKLPTARVGKE
jgi:hypothetical protein